MGSNVLASKLIKGEPEKTIRLRAKLISKKDKSSDTEETENDSSNSSEEDSDDSSDATTSSSSTYSSETEDDNARRKGGGKKILKTELRKAIEYDVKPIGHSISHYHNYCISLFSCIHSSKKQHNNGLKFLYFLFVFVLICSDAGN